MLPERIERRSLTVNCDAIARYGELTHDPNPIHYDRRFAATTEMGGIIAQGTLGLNVLWASVVATFGDDAIAQAVLDVRFVRPVREDDIVTADGWRDADDPRRYRVQVSNQRGENVIEGTLVLPGLSAPT